MPRLGPAFLHQELPALSQINGAGAWRWFVEGIALIAPRHIRETGFRAVMRLERADADAGDALVIERSALGAQRVRPATTTRPGLRRAIEIRRSDIFETRANLPAAAGNSVEEAVAHRLDTLSPLPVADVAYAVGAPTALLPDRIEAPVAIIRRKLIDEARAAPGGDAIALIGADADEAGRFRYVFFESGADGPASRRRALLFGALFGSAVLLLTGASAQLDRRIAATRAHQAALSEALRAEKAAAAFLEEPPPAPIAGMSGTEAASLLGKLATSLPEHAWIEEIALASEGATVQGFAPIEAAWPEGAAPSKAPSDRPGVQSFVLSMTGDAEP